MKQSWLMNFFFILLEKNDSGPNVSSGVVETAAKTGRRCK
jgi:hypothetical protein